MGKLEECRKELRKLKEWDAFLLEHSGLPGPRGNLELAHAAAQEGREAQFLAWLTWTPERAPTGTAEEYLAFCGTLGLGYLVAQGRADLLPRVRALASDPRWRTREAVAMGMQAWGVVNMDALLGEMRRWAQGNPLEMRAAVASLCEPRLLRSPPHARAVLDVLQQVMERYLASAARRGESGDALRKGLAYGWSVAVVALPAEGKALLEAWLESPDKDARWVLKENLKKARLARMDAAWVERSLQRLKRAQA